MPADIKELLLRAKGLVTDATDNIFVIYAEKGQEPFKKPLAVAVPVLLVLYFIVYSPLAGKIRAAAFKLDSSQAISQGAGDYQDAKARLVGFQSKLPLLKDKDDWLNYLLMSTSRAHNISFDVLSAQTEEDAGGFVVVSRKVELVTTYDTLGRWLADVESSPIFLRVVSMSAQRDGDNPTRVKVSVKLSTLFAKPGLDAGVAAAGGAAAGGAR